MAVKEVSAEDVAILRKDNERMGFADSDLIQRLWGGQVRLEWDRDEARSEIARLEAKIERLRAERDKWVEYVTCDRAELVLALEAALARAEKAEAQLHRRREEDRAIQEFLARDEPLGNVGNAGNEDEPFCGTES